MSLSEVDAFMAALKEGYTLILPLVAEVGTELKSICECASAERGEVLFYDLVCSSAVDRCQRGPVELNKEQCRFQISDFRCHRTPRWLEKTRGRIQISDFRLQSQ